jgi:hypothetical protein
MTGAAVARRSHLARWQTLNVTLLVFGYAGYYLCRSNLSVTMPLIIREGRGISPSAACLGNVGRAANLAIGGWHVAGVTLLQRAYGSEPHILQSALQIASRRRMWIEPQGFSPFVGGFYFSRLFFQHQAELPVRLG